MEWSLDNQGLFKCVFSYKIIDAFSTMSIAVIVTTTTMAKVAIIGNSEKPMKS